MTCLLEDTVLCSVEKLNNLFPKLNEEKIECPLYGLKHYPHSLQTLQSYILLIPF